MILVACPCTCRLRDVHVGLPPSGVPGGRQHLVQGSYEYYHYMQVSQASSRGLPSSAACRMLACHAERHTASSLCTHCMHACLAGGVAFVVCAAAVPVHQTGRPS